MKRSLGFAFVLLLLPGIAAASPFDWAPEDYQPWTGGFPYQRNIDWVFDVDPAGGPSPSGTPGAHYEGTADSWLRASDFVALGGSMTWYSSVGGLPYQGLVGIDNRSGNAPTSGQILFHLDNIPSVTALKRIWIEWDYVASGTNIPVTFFVGDSEGNLPQDQWVSGVRQIDQDGLLRQNLWFELRPSPSWEEIVIQLPFIPTGGYFFIDRFHVATESIPEPGSALLLGLSGVGLVWFARRRQQKTA